MARRSDNSGFTLIEVLIVVIVIAVVGALGYTFYSRLNNQMAKTNQSAVADDVPAPPEINEAGDLDKASAALDQADPEVNEDDMSQLIEKSSTGF